MYGSSHGMINRADNFTKTLLVVKLKRFQYNLNLGRLQARGNVRDKD
jgi:hypothetical protein